MRVDQKDCPRRPEIIIRPSGRASQGEKEFVPRDKSLSWQAWGRAGGIKLQGWVGEMEIKTLGTDKLSRRPESIIRPSRRASSV